MSITTSSKIFEIGDTEYGYCCNSFTPIQAGSSIAMYIPSLMGGIERTGRKQINTNRLFANADSCRPSFDSSVYSQKCVYPVLRSNMNWLDLLSSDGCVPAGTRFLCQFANGNVDNIFFTSQ